MMRRTTEGRAIGVRNRGAIDLHLYAMAAVAFFSGLLLWWTNVSWRESLEAYQPVFSKLRLARADVVKGYLDVVRHLAGEPDIRLTDVDAFFEQASGQIVDIGEILDKAGSLGSWRRAGASPRIVLDAYGRSVTHFQKLVAQALAGTSGGLSRYGLELHSAFSALEKQADALQTDVQQGLTTAISRQDRLNTVLFWLWLSFLFLLALTLSLAAHRRRRAEEAMLESESKYRTLFEQGMDAILLVAEDTGEVLDCNQAVTSEWGYDREELIGRNPSFLQPPSPLADVVMPTEVRYPNGRRAVLRETRLMTRFGEIRDMAVKTGFFSLDQRQVRLAIYRDVTERKKGETALHEREAMLRRLGDNLPEGMIFKLVILPGGARRYLYVSQGVERIFGVSAAAVLANAAVLDETLCPGDRERLAQAERAVLRSLAAMDFQVCLREGAGAGRWVQFRAVPRRGADGEIVFDGVVSDITAQKRIEESLRQAKAEAEAASQAKSEFLANISHEVRTPLNGVLAMLQLLKATPLDEASAANVDTALTAARGLIIILADILDFSLLDAGRLVIRRDVVALRVLAADVMRMLSVECCRKGIKARLAVSGEVPPWIATDAARLRQILFNVVGNAVKFTERGGVRLEVDLASAVGETLNLLFTVRDTGIGIAEEGLEAIFEPFTQIDGSLTRKHGGTGLGLGIVKRLVALLDGYVQVESVQGQGTVFAFTIRCRRGDAPRPEPAQVRPAAAVRKPFRVLVVEDEAVNRMATVAMLRRLGYAAEAVEDGEQVLAALARGAFDVVLMDIQMPRVNGEEATRRIRYTDAPGVDPHIPVIALTAHAMSGDRERYLRCGMDDYLSKPVDMASLDEAIARVCSRGCAGADLVGEQASSTVAS